MDNVQITTSSIYQTRVIGNCAILDIDVTHLDFRNAEITKAALNALVEQGARKLALNLSNVTFMDSSGLGVLLFYNRALGNCTQSDTAPNNHKQLALFGLQPYVLNLINTTRLDRSLRVFDSEADALAQLRKP